MNYEKGKSGRVNWKIKIQGVECPERREMTGERRDWKTALIEAKANSAGRLNQNAGTMARMGRLHYKFNQ